MSDTYARVNAAAHSGAFGINEMQLPTAEQCRAGNYLKGRTVLHGMPIAIEVPQGQRRMGKSDGKPWSTILMAHYGYLAGTQGADGDALDIFVGPVPESQSVWVVNQINKDGSFDEHKLLLGYIDEETARSAYMNSYERGWTGLGSLVACSIEQLKWWVKFGNTTIPLTERALPHDGAPQMNDIVWDNVTAEPVGHLMSDLIHHLRQDDCEGLLLDAVSVSDIMEDSDGEEVLDALVVEYAKAERKAEQLRKIMDAMGGSLKAVAVQVTPPFKQRGTTNVVFLFELSDGQTISIFLHNPDSTPHRILPQDELVSWSWRLNKKDVSILVAPEKGQDLNPREVARRIMKLAERNSARFGKANATRAQRMESIEGLKGEVASKESALAALDALFSELTVKVEAKRALPPKATLQANDQLPEGWTEVSPGGMATNRDPLKGGIIDKAVVSGEWFVIFERDGIAELDGFASRAEAFAAHAAALAAADAAESPQAPEVSILAVADVMARWNMDVLYANAEASQLLVAAQARGWVSRRSTTQIDWTEAGVEALRVERTASFLDLVRNIVPAEFETRDDAEGFTGVAVDGLGIRVKHGPRNQSVLVYVLDEKGQDSMGSTGTDEQSIRTLVETALAVIAAKRAPVIVPAAQSRTEWEELVYEAIEAEDITRSDAQGIVEAQGSMIDDLFAAGTQPADAAAAILAASTSIGSQDPASIEGLGEVAANTGHDAEQTAARAFLKSVIDGGVDYFDPELVGKLEAIHDQYGSSDDVIELFNLAAQAFSDYMVAQAGAAN